MDNLLKNAAELDIRAKLKQRLPSYVDVLIKVTDIEMNGLFIKNVEFKNFIYCSN